VITLGQRSLDRLSGVHPDLIRVVKRAAQLARLDQDFTVLEGVRSRENMMVNWGKGRTAAQCAAKGIPASYAKPALAKVTWLNDPFNSPHKARPGGGRAVDLAPFPIDWNDKARFVALHDLMMSAAHIEGVHIRWGKDWDEDGKYEEKGETDGPHFELVGYGA